jgi:hypothetical protein
LLDLILFPVVFHFFVFAFVCSLFFYCSFSNSLGHRQSNFPNFPICSDGVFLSSSSPKSVVVNSHIPDAPRSNASREPNWRRLVRFLNSASESDPANVTVQEGGNASPAMNDVLPGTTTKDRRVALQAPASMRINSDSVSNEIDESDLQSEKHDEQRT